jgi:hypothetical protein
VKPFRVMALRTGGGIPWTPIYLTVPASGWWDDSTAATNVSGAASTWSDKNSSAFDLQQTTAASRPTINATGLNGLRTLTFDGTNDFLISNNATARAFSQNASSLWAFVVVRKVNVDGVSTNRTIVASNTESGSVRFGHSLGSTAVPANRTTMVVRRLTADSAAVLGGATNLGTGWRLTMVTQDYTNRAGLVYLDGLQDASNPTLTTAGSTANTIALEQLVIGASVNTALTYSSFADMEIAALLIGRNGLPTPTERQKMEGWAAWRYGLTANLDASHPYKSSPPFL